MPLESQVRYDIFREKEHGDFLQSDFSLRMIFFEQARIHTII